MGRASKDDTVAGIYQAFLCHRTWRQAELARRVGVSTKTLRQRLAELEARGMPLHAEEDAPDVYWSVPKSWFPGGVTFTAEEAAQLLRELWFLPASRRRDCAVAKLLGGLRQPNALQAAGDAVVPMALSAAEALQREAIEEALLARSALRIRYFSASRGELGWRNVSPARLVAGPPLRVVACCHRSDKLRWFRVDGIVDAALDASESFRPVPSEEVDRFVTESTNGYRDDSPVLEHVFFVRSPEARWVTKNLLSSMRAEPTDGGIRVIARTAGVLPVARFVVSLGSAARVETALLGEMVRELAVGALASTSRPIKADGEDARLNKVQVRRIRQPR